jgi:hypothetical protein
MKALRSFETAGLIDPMPQRHKPQDLNLRRRFGDNFQTCT